MLERALGRVRQLPKTEQDRVAAMILEELEEERRWNEAFSRSPETLAKPFAEAEEDERLGKVSAF